MKECSIFQLDILSTGTTCNFVLSWGESKPIYAETKYPEKLDELYQDWHKFYFTYYHSQMRGSIEEELDFTPEDNDWQPKLANAEQELLTEFQTWLGKGNLKAIRDKIIGVVLENGNNTKSKKVSHCVRLLIGCQNFNLARLPWESWQILPENNSNAELYISRTIITTKELEEVIPARKNQRKGKPRILAVLAASEPQENKQNKQNNRINVNQDKEALRILKRVANVEILEYKNQQDDQITLEQYQQQCKQKLINKLTDDRGWDGLIFAGHSDESQTNGGKIRLADNVDLSLGDINAELEQAKSLGLRFALFNSCKGLSIAQYLIELGLHQVLIMREKIHDSVAAPFLKEFCQFLAKHENVQQALTQSCQFFVREKITYPSGYLIPSLFCNPSVSAELFYLERVGFQRWWKDWKPTKREGLVLGTALIISNPLLYNIFYPIQDFLFESRILAQAIYRDMTKQILEKEPIITLVSIDEDSIVEARKVFEKFNTGKIDRRYLSNLIDKAVENNAKIIGINYVLDSDEEYQNQLNQSIQDAIEKHQTFFIFAARQTKQDYLQVLETTGDPRWSLSGNARFRLGDVKPPSQDNITCDTMTKNNLCPFAYLLALVFKLQSINNSNNRVIPNLESSDKLNILISNKIKEYPDIIKSLKQAFLPFGWSSIIDFSIDPKYIYQKISAKEFSENKSINLENKIIIIAAGGYYDSIGKYPLPWAVLYHWKCPPFKSKISNGDDENQDKCNNFFTEGENHAYMADQINSEHRVTYVPELWLILIAGFLGKWLSLELQQKQKSKRYQLLYLLIILASYQILVLQLYIVGAVLIPSFFPSLIIFSDLLPITRRKIYV
jgi:hypothetical protein